MAVMTLVLTLACVLLAPLAFRKYLDHKRRARPFPLMKLPPEVRSMILDELVTHDLRATATVVPARHPRPRRSGLRPSYLVYPYLSNALRRVLSPISPLVKGIQMAFPAGEATAGKTVYPALTLASAALRNEFLRRFTARGEFRFALDAAKPDASPMWALTPETRALVRRVHVTVLVNPGSSSNGPAAHAPAAQSTADGGAAALGPGEPRPEAPPRPQQQPFAFDPRSPPSDAASWALPARVHGALADMPRLEGARVTVRAAGNQLWNPLWLWHYGSQAFKRCPAAASGAKDVLRRIDFALDVDVKGWLVQELNHLERGLEAGGDAWEWRCRERHLVAADEAGTMPIRRFCTMLYRECGVCEPVAAAGAGDADP